jgi:general secretion pathway protein C
VSYTDCNKSEELPGYDCGPFVQPTRDVSTMKQLTDLFEPDSALVRLLARRGPRVLVGALALALLAETWSIGMIWRPQKASFVPASATPRPGVSPAQIIAAHLFGAGTPAPEISSLPLVLSGTIAITNDPAHGLAIIGPNAQSARLAKVGDTIAPGVTLQSVYRDHVVISRGGSDETLILPTLRGPLLAAFGLAPTDDDQLAAEEASNSPEKIRTALADADAKIGHLFHPKGAFDGGNSYRGVVIQPSGNAELLRAMGLRPSDMIIGINHATVDDPSRLEALTSGKTVTVTVRRPEGTVDVIVDTAALRGHSATPPPSSDEDNGG